MDSMKVLRLFAVLLALVAGSVRGEDSNVIRPVADLEQRLSSMPFEILKAEKARGIKEDVALKSEVKFQDGVELRIKIRPANYGGSEFNNEPRYEAAAYELQKAFLDEGDAVVPPTELRALKREQIGPVAPAVPATFRGSNDVLAVLQYWLKTVSGPNDVWDAARFERDKAYAKHVANLNVLTYLIAHGDSNAGNILLSTDPQNPRVFAVDNGVAFRSLKSDRGQAWRSMRVPSIPKQTVERLRALDRDRLNQVLGAVGTWRIEDAHLVRVEGEPVYSGAKGVRTRDGKVQLGLTPREILDVETRRKELLEMVDKGKLGSF